MTVAELRDYLAHYPQDAVVMIATETQMEPALDAVALLHVNDEPPVVLLSSIVVDAHLVSDAVECDCDSPAPDGIGECSGCRRRVMPDRR